jgi:acetyl-CoA carboxylase biotin carboxyl carrier protein
MDIKEIQSLIKFVAKSGASEVKLEMKDIKITIRTGQDSNTTIIQQAPQEFVQQAAASTQQIVAAPVATETAEDSKYITIKSPMIGTFYRKPSPDKPNFAEVGDSVSEGSTVCIIEAMKLFNEIESEISGKIVKILVDDASPVEFDQPLFLVDPS